MRTRMNFNIPDIKRKLSEVEWIELTLATCILIFSIVAMVTDGPDATRSLWGINHLYYILIMIISYVSFLLLSFLVVPNLRSIKYILFNLSIIVFIILVSAWISSATQHHYLMIILPTYFFIKYGMTYIWKRLPKPNMFITWILLAALFYIMTMLLVIIGQATPMVITLAGLLIPLSVLQYIYSFKILIPQVFNRKKPYLHYLIKIGVINIIVSLPLGVMGMSFSGDDDNFMVIITLNILLQFLITAPLSWYVYLSSLNRNREIQALQKDLGKTEAELNFLRSQINPHFLFNALNTVYATALQENAERSAEAIQMLGDMMRFMLNENVQSHITLEKEVEYLKNYIHLQKLRIANQPNILISADLPDEGLMSTMIAPMLLIPFIENAFKHGISMRQPSAIKISLTRNTNTMYFTVMNTKHEKSGDDPEKFKNGIGLENVIQRLQLLYPQQHELNIEETDTAFNVQLKLTVV